MVYGMTLYICSGLTLVLLVGIVVGLESQLHDQTKRNPPAPTGGFQKGPKTCFRSVGGSDAPDDKGLSRALSTHSCQSLNLHTIGVLGGKLGHT